MTTFAETTLPALVFTVPAGHPKGDVSALGRLTINEAQAVDQAWVTWGCETNDKYDITASSAALFYEAESLTAMGGAATAVGPTGASGGGSNVMRTTSLSTSYQAIVSTQATGGGAHLSHVGQFRVYARVQVPTTNAGSVSVALEWSTGDFRRPTRNDAVTLQTLWGGTWRLLDLGAVSIPKVLTGTQRWEGRIVAQSTTAGDDLDIDYLMLIPADTGSGVASAVLSVPAPTAFSARDEFDQTAGALVGKTAPVGGTWSGAGDTGDFAVETTGKTAERTTTTDTGIGRLERLGTGTATLIALRVDFKQSVLSSASGSGVFGRYVDANNYARFAAFTSGSTLKAGCTLVVASTFFNISPPSVGIPAVNGQWYTLQAITDTLGRFWVWLYPQGSIPGSPQIAGFDSRLATGGTLASGGYGMWDIDITTVNTRNYDNFAAWVPALDAAMFASQSLEIRWDGAIREDSAGAIWQDVSSYEGDRLLVPPTSREQRSVRFIVKACRSDPSWGPDGGIDDINATLAVTPRYLSVPTPV